jgi:c(7)-type cytochrome triheme protein
MTTRGYGVALGTLLVLLAGCGLGDRTGFNVPVNADAIAVAGSTALPPDLYYPNTEAGDVVFSHGVHMIFASACDECHPEWPTKQSAPGSMPMAPMYDGESCGRCHDGVASFEATDCGRCHDLSKGGVTLPDRSLPGGGFGTVVFSHNMHLLAGSTCAQCHPEHWTWRHSPPGTMTMSSMYGSDSCGSCHDGQEAFDTTDCGRCHDRDAQSAPPTLAEGSYPADREWPGTDEYGVVVFSHTLHAIAGESCDACHPFLFPEAGIEAGKLTMESMYAGQSCGRCHDGKRTFAATDCGGCHEGATNPVISAQAAEAAAAVEPTEG